MILQPLRGSNRGFTARTNLVGPPVGGWNSRDVLDAMDPSDAIALDNWFPRQRDVIVRQPYALHCDTGETLAVEGLATHNGTGGSKLIAFTNGKAINCTTDTPATLSALLTAGSEVYGWNFKGSSFYANGVDALQSYDGTTFGAAGYTKDVSETATYTATDVTFGMGFSNRNYIGDPTTLGFWYSSVNAVTGPNLKYFPLDGILNKGGTIAAMGAMTDDEGAGRNDFACFISTEGEVAIYKGSDPGDASNWAIVGVYDVGSPVSRFGVTKLGADLVFITSAGYVPMSAVLSSAAKRSERFALSDKISSEATDATERYRGNDGWRVIVIPKSSKLVINVPRSGAAQDQHVMNTVTGAWCRFRDVPAVSMSILNRAAYFGSTDGKVYALESETFSATTRVTATASGAWNYYRRPGILKQFTQAQPIFVSNASPLLQISFATDFGNYQPTGNIQASTAPGVGIWDQGVWDTAVWAGVSNAASEWVGIAGLGYAGSMKIRAAEVEAAISWVSTRVMYNPGGPR